MMSSEALPNNNNNMSNPEDLRAKRHRAGVLATLPHPDGSTHNTQAKKPTLQYALDLAFVPYDTTTYKSMQPSILCHYEKFVSHVSTEFYKDKA